MRLASAAHRDGSPYLAGLTFPFVPKGRASRPGEPREGVPPPFAAFTLIELLVVVMLLTVLMLAAFPAFRGLERSANRHRAVAEADAIAQAALAYRRTYGQWPREESAMGLDAAETAIVAGRPEQVTPQHLDIADVVAVLRNAQTDTDHNPRRMLFLELPEDRIDTDGTPLDPWGQPYVLVMSRLGENNSVATVARHEGGNRTSVRRSQASAPTVVEGPEDAVAFSWGDPASKADEPCLFSWSKR